jgi:hypothetical protein
LVFVVELLGKVGHLTGLLILINEGKAMRDGEPLFDDQVRDESPATAS